MRSTNHRLAAQTLICVTLFHGLLLARPTLARSSDVTRCVNNLRNLDLEKRIIAEDRKLKPGDAIDKSWIETEFRGIRACPSGGVYTIGPVGTPASCSVTNHTEAEAQRTYARWRRERRNYTIYSLAVMTASIGAPIVAVILAVRWYRRRNSLRSATDD